MERSKHLGTLINTLTKECFGVSLGEAHEKSICIQCKGKVDAKVGGILSPEDRAEYEISGFCPKCQDHYFDKEER